MNVHDRVRGSLGGVVDGEADSSFLVLVSQLSTGARGCTIQDEVIVDSPLRKVMLEKFILSL